MSRFITLHILNALPYSNLNRDDAGLPKSLSHGGVERGMLSSQSLKRAARIAFEENVSEQDRSFRSSRGHADVIGAKAVQIAADTGGQLDLKKAVSEANRLVKSLVAKPSAKGKDTDKETDAGKDSSVWLSADETIQLAIAVAAGCDAIPESFGADRKTLSLSIAMFGRMFANAKEAQTDAAVAVSPATMTHAMQIESDYFTAADDLVENGASFLSTANYTTGVYYRTVTIDPRQLRRSWAGIDADGARNLVASAVRQLIVALPTGKINSTNAHTAPELVLVETQDRRQAYNYETPVAPTKDVGGFVAGSIERLSAMRDAALAFDPESFGPAAVTGTAAPTLGGLFDGVDRMNLPQTVERITDFLLEEA